MAQGISLIVGLGNPGQNYADTRHNAGLRFLAALAARQGMHMKQETRFSGAVGKIAIDGHDVWLLAPNTYMNHSGEAVAKLSRFYKIDPEAILVVHDELDLAPGTVRLKLGGGHGGHNGLRDIVEKLGAKDFVRMRIGIGHPGSSSQVTSYVLKKAPQVEQSLIDAAIDNGLDYIEAIVRGEHEQAMNALHTHTVHT